MKVCFKCQQAKPRSEFYKHSQMGDGLLGKCKSCTKQDAFEHRLRNPDRLREYDRQRAALPHRVALAKRVHVEWKAKHPERRAAHVKLGNAVRDGRVDTWPVCAMPDCDREPEAHHTHYDAPLDVVWLCPAHHRQAHAMARKAA